MNLDHRILLAQNIANPVAAIQQGVQAAGQATQLSRQNALDTLYRDQGAQIASGDQNALNALAGFDPMASLGVQDARQTMQARTQNMEQARAAGARAAQQHAMNMSQAERQAEHASTLRLYQQAQLALQSGNMQAFKAITRQLTDGQEVSPDDFPMLAASIEGGLEALSTAREFNAGPSEPAAVQGLRFRAREAGLVEGTPEYAQFMMAGGTPRGTSLQVGADGSINFAEGQGVGGAGGGAVRPGTAPAGYSVVADPSAPDGTRMVPTPGGPAEAESEATRRKAIARQAQKARAGGTVIQDLQRAMDLLPELGALASGEGIVGGIARTQSAKIPGSVANRITQFTESALSNVGLDTLQAMRENSPTGGALGQVPIQQQQRLEQVLGSLQINQPPEVLEANIKRVMNIYTDIIHGSPEERAEAVRLGEMSAAESAQIDGFYYELPFDERGRPRQSVQPAQTQGQPGAAPGDFSAMTLNEVQSVDVGTLTPDQIRAFNARMRELLQ